MISIVPRVSIQELVSAAGHLAARYFRGASGDSGANSLAFVRSCTRLCLELMARR